MSIGGVRFEICGSGCNADTVAKSLPVRMRVAGMRHWEPASLTAATRLKHADAQDHTISEQPGHVNENMITGRYAKRPDVQRLAQAFEKLDHGKALDALRSA